MANEELVSHIEKHLRHIEDRKTGGFEWDKNNAEVYRIALSAITSEARTVSVKLPKTMYTEFDNDDYCREVAVLDKQQVIDVLAAAGIKLEVGE